MGVIQLAGNLHEILSDEFGDNSEAVFCYKIYAVKKGKQMNNKDNKSLHSSAAEYLTFVAATGGEDESVEMRYEDENIWLTQKMMSTLYDVSVPAINQHIKKIFNDGELNENSVIKNYLITAADGKMRMTDVADAEQLLRIIQSIL